MAVPTIIRGSKFTGHIDFKMVSSADTTNIFEYVVAAGAVVQVHLPPADPLVPVVLSSATNLPNPPYTITEVVIDVDRKGCSFTCTPTKSLLMAVESNLPIDVKVINDPATSPNPLDIDFFEKLKVITVKDPENT